MSAGVEVKRAVCNFCHERCRVAVHVENGHMVKVDEDKTFPLAGSTAPPLAACLRLRGAKEWMYHPDRLNYPLKRVGEKGEGKWQVISWEQALNETAEKLREIKERYGGEAIAGTNGTGRTPTDIELPRFLHLVGSANFGGAGNICWGPFVSVSNAMFGWCLRYGSARAIGDEGKSLTKCMLITGVNPSQSRPRFWKSLREMKKLGCKVIVIDPRKTHTAEVADVWLQLRPGTDAALLLSMINVIIEEGLYDKEFVEKWCYGFDKVVERAREYPPEKVAEITWVPAEKIREAARMYATNRPASCLHGMGLEHQQYSIEAIQARFILTAITGNLDVEGGECMPGPGRVIPLSEISMDGILSPEQKAKQLGADRFKLMARPGRDMVQEHTKQVWGRECGSARGDGMAHEPSIFRAILTGEPYPVKALITVASNPMVTPGNSKLVYKALKSLELYIVADYFMTPSAELADYVFPISSWMERPWLWDTIGGDCNVRAGEKALPSTIPGEYDRKTDYEFFRELGIRLGQEEHWPWRNLEELFDYQLQPMGLTFREFMDKGGYDFPPPQHKKYEKMGFATLTGKAELYSTVFERLGYDPLPHHEESFESPVNRPDLAREYPLMLISGGRFIQMFHSEHRQIDSVRRKHPHPLVQVNPKTARELGIEDGDWIWIESPRGRVRMKCRYFEGIDPRVVHAEHGWWLPELPGEEPWLHGVWESNINVLTEDDPDVCNELNGGWPLKEALCKIYKCKQY